MALYTNSVTSHLKDLDRTAYSIVEQAKATNQVSVIIILVQLFHF